MYRRISIVARPVIPTRIDIARSYRRVQQLREMVKREESLRVVLAGKQLPYSSRITRRCAGPIDRKLLALTRALRDKSRRRSSRLGGFA